MSSEKGEFGKAVLHPITVQIQGEVWEGLGDNLRNKLLVDSKNRLHDRFVYDFSLSSGMLVLSDDVC